MHNPIPSIFGTDYKDGFEENRAWATPSFRRHVELTNVISYAPTIISLASSALGKDVVGEIEAFVKDGFDLF